MTPAGVEPWPYVSTSLIVATLDLPASAPAIWFRTQLELGGPMQRLLLYRLTPEVYAWLLWKLQRSDQQWTDANGGVGLDARTRENMLVVASRIPGLVAAARAFGVQPQAWTTKPPELPRPPCKLADLEYLDQFERWMAEMDADPGGGWRRFVERRYTRHVDLQDPGKS